MRKIFFIPGIFIIAWFSSCSNPLSFSDYHTPSSVESALNTLHSDYPALTQIVTIGNSVENQPIKALKISSNPLVNDPAKGDVVFVGCHHAREWMSVEIPLYVANQLLSKYTTNAQLKADMDNLQIWIIPVLNVDGFQYTQTAANRYWRKNRRNNGDGTFGVDMNRNYSYQWGLTGSGISADPFTAGDAYFGPSAFSEPELTSLRGFMQGLGNLKAFFSYHSYGEWHMKPWSYTFSDAPGHETLHSIAIRDISRIAAVHGVNYKEIFTLYNASGEATDYWWNEKRIAALTTELRPVYNGSLQGFSPPASEIIPCAEENYPAALAIIHDAALPHIWLRDNAGDNGSEPSSGYTWESPDIWTVPAILNQGAVVDLHVKVNNSTGSAVHNVTVDAYYSDPRITLEFPSLSSVPIGSTTVNVPPGGKDVVFSWTTPVGVNIWGERHWCVGAVVKQDDDMPLTTIVRRSSNIACHNFNTTEIISGGLLNVAATNFLNVAAELIVDVNRNELPPGWRIELPPVKQLQDSLKLTPSSQRKSLLLKTLGVILEPGETIKIPIRVYFENPPSKEVLVRIKGSLVPLVPGNRTPIENGYTFNVIAKKR